MRYCVQFSTARALVASFCFSCGPGLPTSGQLGGSPFNEDQSCKAVRPQTEPDLMGWDAGSRAKIDRLAESGLVAVRYSAKGCNVELEVLSHCIGTSAKYKYKPYWSTETKTAKDAGELYAELPLGAASLKGRLKGSHVLRTDYRLVGQLSIPPNAVVDASTLDGPDCSRATHVVSTLYVGGFALVDGDAQHLSAVADVFLAEAGGRTDARRQRVFLEGDPEACERARTSGKLESLCGMPLRLALLQLHGAGPNACSEGSKWDGKQCVLKQTTSEVNCSTGTEYVEGQGCVAVSVTEKLPPNSDTAEESRVIAGMMSEGAVRARRLFDGEQWDQAATALRRVVDGNTGDDVGNRQLAQYYLAICHFRLKRFDECLVGFAHIAESPHHLKHAEALPWLARLSTQRGTIGENAMAAIVLNYSESDVSRFNNAQQKDLYEAIRKAMQRHSDASAKSIPAGAVHCTPVSGLEILTRQPIPITCNLSQGAVRGELYYKPVGANEYVATLMEFVDGTLRGEVPCDALARSGTLSLYVVEQDKNNAVVDTFGNGLSPAKYLVVDKTLQAAPSYPGQSPPMRCNQRGQK